MDNDIDELARLYSWNAAYLLGVRHTTQVSRRKQNKLRIDAEREAHLAFENWYAAAIAMPRS